MEEAQMQIARFVAYLRTERRYSEHTVLGYERDVRRFAADMLAVAGVIPDRGEGRKPSRGTPGRKSRTGLPGKPDEKTETMGETGAEEIAKAQKWREKEESAIAAFDFRPVTPDDIRSWIVLLSERERLRPSSVNRMTCSLRALFRYLRKTGLTVKDPFLRIGFQRTPARLPDYIPESKMKSVVAGLDAESRAEEFILRRNSLVVLLFYSTGIRLAELAGIRRDDFSADFRELKVRGKGNRERVVPVLEHVRERIMAYAGQINAGNSCASGENSLFLTREGKPLSRAAIGRIVKEQLAAAGVQGKRSPHVLRHTFATHLLNDGADIREIQELLGHNTLRATQVYTHNSVTALKKAYEGAHPRARKNKKLEELIMNVKIQSVKFDADKKLIDFVHGKMAKLERFVEDAISAEVILKVDKDTERGNKVATIKVSVPGADLVADFRSKSFEESVDGAIGALKKQVEKHKERVVK